MKSRREPRRKTTGRPAKVISLEAARRRFAKAIRPQLTYAEFTLTPESVYPVGGQVAILLDEEEQVAVTMPRGAALLLAKALRSAAGPGKTKKP